MIKLVTFDLDGVLADLKDVHFEALNSALLDHDPSLVITVDEHYKFYDGLPTKEKLKLLTKYKGLQETSYSKIEKLKQKHTLKYIYQFMKPSEEITCLFEELKRQDLKICVATNSVANTVYSVLVKMNILQFVDKVISNEDVKYPKPNPEIYFKAISHFGLIPKECLVLEDSPYGLEAAHESGSTVLKVKDSSEVNIENVMRKLKEVNNLKNQTLWDGKNFHVIVPMAGLGSRFSSAGYDLPKPLIDVNGIPMIEKVVSNLGIDAKFIFIVQKEHEKFDVSNRLRSIKKDCEIIYVDKVTEGAACTTLLAKKFIDNDNHLLIVNSDQFVEWNSNRFYYQITDQNVDASIVTFNSSHPKWSFVRLDKDNYVIEVAEKNPISDMATVGIYYWKKGSDYVKYAEQMIQKNIRVNNEFYVCPVFNEAILDNKKISTYNVDKMWGLGTPEDLNNYLKFNT
jgi:HAD superfamily hydrolase (TIGR01509 family)